MEKNLIDKQFYKYSSPIGELIYACKNNKLVSIGLNKGNEENKEPIGIENDFSKKVSKELDEYFEGKRKTFDIELAPEGTDFQKKVWSELLKIPYGETCTYKDIATAIGNPNASRAVGGANNKNPIPIIVPCHRVIGANKSLVGYAYGLEVKKYLLNLEVLQELCEDD